MEKIVESKKGKVDKEFWRGMLKREVNKEGRFAPSRYLGEYEEDYITGWILNFFNYNDKGHFVQVDKIKLENLLNVSSQIKKSTFIVEDFDKKEHEMEFNAGFLGMKQDLKTLEVSPVIGWYIDESSKEKRRTEIYMNSKTFRKIVDEITF